MPAMMKFDSLFVKATARRPSSQLRTRLTSFYGLVYAIVTRVFIGGKGAYVRRINTVHGRRRDRVKLKSAENGDY